MQKIPVSLIGGFLGSGKTTLLNRIINQRQGLRIGVLVNDFGEVNIDSQLIANVEGETISLSNGCVCCTIRGDLVAAMLQMVHRHPAPDHIVIETSGVSEPNAAAMSLVMSTELAARTQLDAIITVVDADAVLGLDGKDRHLAVDQVRVADIVVINKTDLAGGDQVERVERWVRSNAPQARTLCGSHGQVPLELLLGTELRSLRPEPGGAAHETLIGHDDHDHGHDHASHGEDWSSLSWTDPEPMAFEAVYRVFNTLPIDIFRAKGILNLREVPDRRVVLQMVGKRVLLSKGEPWAGAGPVSQIVVIGRKGCVDREALESQFRACQVPPAQGGENPFVSAVVEILRT